MPLTVKYGPNTKHPSITEEERAPIEKMEMEPELVRMCIAAATESAAAVEKWRRQRRSLERMPFPLAEALFHQLLRRRLLFPSLLEVFKYSVEEIDLRGESCVDAEWMAYLGGYQYLRAINLADCKRLNSSALWAITGMTNLTEVDVSRCSKITDAGIRHILSIPSLEKLCISETGVTADGVAVLASLTNLTTLDLGGLPVTDSVLRSLQALKKLTHLDLWGSRVSNDGAVLLRMFPNLNFLNLAWTGVTRLPSLLSLAVLNMSNCTIHSLFQVDHPGRLEQLLLSGAVVNNVSEALRYVETSRLGLLDLSNSSLDSFSFLQSMNALTHLNLSGSSLVDDSTDYIASIGATLRHLNLSNTKITSEGIGALAGHVANLETLVLSSTPIDDSALSYISMMPSLKAINLSFTNIKGTIREAGCVPEEIPSFSALQNLIHLERFDLEGINITDPAIYPLTTFSKLSFLSLQSVSLTDASLYQVSSVPNLISLSFRDAVLTNAGIDCFIPPPTLEVIDLRGCWLVTKDALLVFRQKHPRIEVRHELVETPEKIDSQFSPPLRKTKKSPQNKHRKQFTSPLNSNENFIDQRRKYSREELLALLYSSALSI